MRRAARGQRPLVVVGVSRVQGAGDGQVHDRVPEVLEALVVTGRLVGMLVQPARMDERLLEQVEVADREAQTVGDGLSGSHVAARRVD